MAKQKPSRPPGSTKGFDWTLLIAALALMVSAVQLVVTVPLISQKLFSPQLIIKPGKLNFQNNDLVGNYYLENAGFTAATNVELGIVAVMGDDIIVFPTGTHDVVNKNPEQVLFINQTVKFDRILPNETFTISVVKTRRTREQSEAAADMMNRMGLSHMPNISFLRSAEGTGDIRTIAADPRRP